ncbi:hypothetical protein BE21_32235 [Sorangium cellulosum]|uniref:Uncharacterized protein n=1 Tax=Sorangium cellulosum TaxID=56 RepID=A0A150TQF8_SORCE|nr:hypothetical protein BE21_32235 [Sorangium cellulosum]
MFERITEVIVGAMLLGLGLWHLARSRTSTRVSRAPATTHARPVVAGLVHGLAGSAGIALLAATTIPSRALAVAYLGLIALGTVVGMVALTVAMARPIGWTMQREGALKHVMAALAALLSMALGIVVIVQACVPEGAP